VQQRVQFDVAGRSGLDEHRQAIAAAPAHPVQHPAVQVDVQVGGSAEALDQRDSAAVALFAFEPNAIQQMARDHGLAFRFRRFEDQPARRYSKVCRCAHPNLPVHAWWQSLANLHGVDVPMGLCGPSVPFARFIHPLLSRTAWHRRWIAGKAQGGQGA